MEGLIVALVIGAIAGWLAGQIMKGGGYGLIGDIVVGIIGGVVGGLAVGRAPSSADRRLLDQRHHYVDRGRYVAAVRAAIDQTLKRCIDEAFVIVQAVIGVAGPAT